MFDRGKRRKSKERRASRFNGVDGPALFSPSVYLFAFRAVPRRSVYFFAAAAALKACRSRLCRAFWHQMLRTRSLLRENILFDVHRALERCPSRKRDGRAVSIPTSGVVFAIVNHAPGRRVTRRAPLCCANLASGSALT